MPLYPFECLSCGEEFALFRGIGERGEPAACQTCGGEARRIVCAPNLSLMSPVRRMAAATNERSQHEPRMSKAGRGHVCRSGCGCGGPSSKGAAAPPLKRTPLGEVKTQKKPNARPWMLGH